MSEISRPVLRYPGGKWKIAPWIIEHFPAHQVYVEVFGGAASVLMRKAPSRTEVYNDIEGRVVNVFRVLRDPAKAEELRRQLELTPFASEEYASCYLDPENEIDDARMMIYRSFSGVGSDSIFRVNGFRRGFKNKKLDANNAMNSYIECIPSFVERLRTVIIENMDWSDLINLYDAKETLFFVDPPYLDEVCTSRSVTYSHPFTDDGHIALLDRLNSIKGNAILCGYWSDMYENRLGDWFTVKRSNYTGMARYRVETLWIKRSDNLLF